MAAENTEPRSGLILQIGLFTVVSLVGIRYGLVSYFDDQMGVEYLKKVGSHKSEQLVALRAEEQKMLTGGAMPIDKAMALMARQGRDRVLPPKPSDDMAAVQGWTQAPNPNASAMMPRTAVPAAGDPGATGDGGAMLSAGLDGGVKLAAGDGATGKNDAGAGATGTRDAGK